MLLKKKQIKAIKKKRNIVRTQTNTNPDGRFSLFQLQGGEVNWDWYSVWNILSLEAFKAQYYCIPAPQKTTSFHIFLRIDVEYEC